MHNLDQLTTLLGSQESVIRAVINELSGRLLFNEIFEDLIVNISGYEVYVRGRMMNGIPKIGTMFIK